MFFILTTTPVIEAKRDISFSMNKAGLDNDATCVGQKNSVHRCFQRVLKNSKALRVYYISCGFVNISQRWGSRLPNVCQSSWNRVLDGCRCSLSAHLCAASFFVINWGVDYFHRFMLPAGPCHGNIFDNLVYWINEVTKMRFTQYINVSKPGDVVFKRGRAYGPCAWRDKAVQDHQGRACIFFQLSASFIQFTLRTISRSKHRS